MFQLLSDFIFEEQDTEAHSLDSFAFYIILWIICDLKESIANKLRFRFQFKYTGFN